MVIGEDYLGALCRNTELHKHWVRVKRRQYMMLCDSIVNENEMFTEEIEEMLRAGVLDEEVPVNFVNIYKYGPVANTSELYRCCLVSKDLITIST